MLLSSSSLQVTFSVRRAAELNSHGVTGRGATWTRGLVLGRILN